MSVDATSMSEEPHQTGSHRALYGALAGNFIAEAAQKLPQFLWSFWLARSLSKFDFGVWTGFVVLMQVTPYLFGLTLSGLDIRYSNLVGAGNVRDARLTAGVARQTTLLLGAVTIAIMSIGLVSDGFRGRIAPGSEPRHLALFLLYLAIQANYAFLGTHLRNRLDFRRVNVAILLGNVVALAVMVSLAHRLGIVACLVAIVTQVSVGVLLWWRHAEYDIPDRSRFVEEARALVRLGGVVLLSGALFDSLRLVTRYFVSQTVGVEALGTYGVCYIASGAVMLGGTSGSRVLIQYLARAEGAAVGVRTVFRRMILLPSVAVGIVAGLSAAFGWAAASVILPHWAPQQASALLYMRPAIYTGIFVSAIFVLLTVLRARQQFTQIYFACGAGLVLQICFLAAASYWVRSLGAMVIAESLTFALVLAGLATMVVAKEPRNLRIDFVKVLALTTLAPIVVMEGAEHLVHGAPAHVHLLRFVLLFAGSAVWTPIAVRIGRRAAVGRDGE